MELSKELSKGVVVSFTDGRDPVRVTLTPRAQVAAERHFGCSLAAMDHVEQIYYMVWASLHYSGKEPRDFDSFLDVFLDAEMVNGDTGGDQGQNPTQPAQPPDSSSS